MKYKMRIAYFLWLVTLFFASLFDQVFIDFPIPISTIALAFTGIIFYLVTYSEQKKETRILHN